jgi:chloramphenicol 3-O phosphotransferase
LYRLLNSQATNFCAGSWRLAREKKMATPGTVILFNGTICSGKSTIAAALQPLLAESYLTVSLEQFRCQPPVSYRHHKGHRFDSAPNDPASAPDMSWQADAQSVATLHQTILTWARAEHNVIAEHTLTDPIARRACAAHLAGLSVWLVGVRCPLAVVEQRAAPRGCEQLAQLRAQFAQVHAHGCYDVEVDTSVLSPAECALAIQQRLQTGPSPRAFAWLKAYTASAYGRGWLRLPPTYWGD